MNLKFFQWHSIKTKITIFTLTIFLIGIWALAFYAVRMLRKDMESELGQQQFSTASFIAAGINTELENRLKTMEMIASKITPAILGKAAAMQAFLEDRTAFMNMFNCGSFVTRLDGIAIADFPHVTGRIGTNYLDRAWLADALKGKSTIGKPVIGKTITFPVFAMAVPIRDGKGKVIGALAGVTNLDTLNFLDKIADIRYGKTGESLLIAPQHKLIITSTDKSRIMKPMTAPGINPLFDRYVRGYEGSGVVVDSRGIEVLSSAKHIPVANWILIVRIPTKEAFAPIRAMQWRMLLATIFMTLLSGTLIWWMLKHQLSPIFTTIKTLTIQSDTTHPPQALAITRQDEIGELINGFNRLLETLGQREKALRESEERYRTAIEQSNDGIALVKGDRQIFVNQKIIEMFGYDRPEEIVGQPITTTVHPDDQERVKEINRQRQNGEAVSSQYEFKGQRKNGELIYIEISASKITYQGEVVTLVYLRNNTERKMIVDALRVSEEHFRSLAENSTDYIMRYDRECRHTYVNPMVLKGTGMSTSDLIGKTHHESGFPEELCQIWEAKIRQVFQTGEPRQTVFEWKSAHGTIFLDWRLAPEFDAEGHVHSVLGVSRDITEQKKAEAALRFSEEKFAKAFQYAPILMTISSLEDGTYLDVNEKFCETSGFSREEAIGKTSIQLGWLSATDRQELLEELRSDGQVVDKELSLSAKDGRKVYCQVSIEKVSFEKGQFLLTLAQDISDRKASEEVILKLNTELEQRVRDRTVELKAINKELEGFSYSISHDLRSPLRHLTGFVNLLNKHMSEGLDEKSRHYLRVISNSAVKLGKLIDDILSFSRMGRVEMQQSPLTLNRLVEELIKGIEPEIKEREVTWSIASLPEAYGDPTMIKMVLKNLIDNAVKYTRGKPQAIIEIGHQSDHGYEDIVYVRDNGAGFDMKYKDKLFGLFQRLHHENEFEGTGLGLANIQRIIHRHGGRVWAEGVVGEGATFFFPLPKRQTGN